MPAAVPIEVTASPAPALPASRRTLTIAAGVLLAHAAALWALQAGMSRESPQALLPAVMTARLLAPAVPAAAPAAARAPQPPAPSAFARPTDRPPLPAIAQRPAPAQPAAASAAQAVANTPTSSLPVPAASAGPAALVGGRFGAPGHLPCAASTGTDPDNARLAPPSSDAAYLKNPKPAYPSQSRRLGEQGQVLLSVFVGADGLPRKAQIARSSGYDRLDQAALHAVLTWRYVPGHRGGMPEALWLNVPIHFVIE